MQIGLDDIAAWHQQQSGSASSTQEQQQQQQSKQPAAAPAEDSSEAGSSSSDGPRDWKGEPMKLNPGERHTRRRLCSCLRSWGGYRIHPANVIA
jgi:hypothetical protein